MPGTPTTRFAWPTLAGTDEISNGPTQLNAALNDIDADVVGWVSGLLSARPAAGEAGRFYFATDVTSTAWPHGTVYFDNGSTWDQMATDAGYLRIPGAATFVSSASFGTPRQPSATRPVFVVATFYTSAGWTAVQVGASSSGPWELQGYFGAPGDITSDEYNALGTVSVWVPTGYYYQYVNSGGAFVGGANGAYETVF